MTTPIRALPLRKLHERLGAKFVAYSGWEMPVSYADGGLLKEHQHTRAQCSIFDVSHMGQVVITGKDAINFAQKATPVDLGAAKEDEAKLSVLMNENSGILDDLILTKRADHVYSVVNAGNRDADMKHLSALTQGMDVNLELLEDQSLLAVQGPTAYEVLGPYIPNIQKMRFMTCVDAVIGDKKVQVTRCGYTGEDGFEVSIRNEDVTFVAEKLLENPTVKFAGLGARDSLRLEAGLCLYGHELNDSINPVEAQLLWLISKARRESGGFIGHEALMKAIAEKASLPTRRVGLLSAGPCPREGTEILVDGNKIGVVTSGSFGPTIGKNVTQAYVQAEFAAVGTSVTFALPRGRTAVGDVSKMPFVPARYHRVE